MNLLVRFALERKTAQRRELMNFVAKWITSPQDKGDVIYYEIDIPFGVVAHLTLPSGRYAKLEKGKYLFAE